MQGTQNLLNPSDIQTFKLFKFFIIPVNADMSSTMSGCSPKINYLQKSPIEQHGTRNTEHGTQNTEHPL